jgi:hypothetical protein
MTNAADKLERLEEARALARRINDAIWRVDSAESLLRKAQPSTGYRSNETLGDQPWNIAYHQREVDKAHLHLHDILMLLELGCLTPIALNGYEERAAQTEAAVDAGVRLPHKGYGDPAKHVR